MLDDATQCYPARRYVMLNDKLHIFATMKFWCDQLRTVSPRQGHYPFDPKIITADPQVDVTILRLGDLVNYDLPALLEASSRKIWKSTTSQAKMR
jgi:hypothetical protein